MAAIGASDSAHRPDAINVQPSKPIFRIAMIHCQQRMVFHVPVLWDVKKFYSSGQARKYIHVWASEEFRRVGAIDDKPPFLLIELRLPCALKKPEFQAIVGDIPNYSKSQPAIQINGPGRD